MLTIIALLTSVLFFYSTNIIGRTMGFEPLSITDCVLLTMLTFVMVLLEKIHSKMDS